MQTGQWVAAAVVAMVAVAARAGAGESTAAPLGECFSTIRVTVDGAPAENIRLHLVFVAPGRITGDGRAVTKVYTTDAEGKAVVQHSLRGAANVWIFNEWECHGSKLEAPGELLIALSTADTRQRLMLDKWHRPHRPAGPANGDAETRPRPPPDKPPVIIVGPGGGAGAE